MLSSAPQPPAKACPGNENESPFHLLMLAPCKQDVINDPKFEDDYLARRQKAYRRRETPPTIASEDNEAALWSGASPFERAIVECCEVEGGGLAKGRELDFLGVIARHCHTTASQALALAVLQRTVDGNDKEEYDSSSDDGEDSCYDESPDDQSESGSAAEEGVNGKSEDSNERPVDIDRISPFLVAGGLQLLKSWFVDSSTPLSRGATSAAPAYVSDTKSNPPTGPILLPLLALLEAIPFNKKLIRETRINKDIRNLKKQLDEAVSTFGAEGVKLQKWRDPRAGGNRVVEVLNALQSLMNSWQEKAVDSSQIPFPQDPFESLRDAMRKRMDILSDYNANHNTKKPEWLERFEEKKRGRKKAPKLSTRQLEALERRNERERLHNQINKTQKEIKEAEERKRQAAERLKQIRLKSQEGEKRKATTENNERKKRKTVQWSDGLKEEDTPTQKDLLETVHEYPPEGREDEGGFSDSEMPEDGSGTWYDDAVPFL